jgi:uncharacterized protein YdaU (DUF1376 family)
MAANNLYMPFHVGDYMADAGHLNTLEHGAYFLLICTYWQRGEPLPADERLLQRLTKVSAEQWTAMSDLILPFFDEKDGRLHHKRIDAELQKARDRSAAAQRSVSQRIAKANRRRIDRSSNDDRAISEGLSNQKQVQEQEVGTSVPTSADTREADFRGSISKVYAKHGHLPPETGTAVVWLKQGRDPDICLAVIDDHLTRKAKKLPLSYFEGPIADAHAAPPAAGNSRAPPGRDLRSPLMKAAQNIARGLTNEPDHNVVEIVVPARTAAS